MDMTKELIRILPEGEAEAAAIVLLADIADMSRAELLATAMALDESAGQAVFNGDEPTAIAHRRRAIAALDAWIESAAMPPAWVSSLHQKQYLEIGTTCDRIARKVKDTTGGEAAVAWSNGAMILQDLIRNYPDQPAWVIQLYERQLLEAGVAFEREGMRQREDANDLGAAEAWSKGASSIRSLINRNPEQPDWVRNSLQKQTREAAFSFQRLAQDESTAAEQIDWEKRARYWSKAAAMLDALMDLGEQPDWIMTAYERQLLEGGVSSDHSASKCKGIDDERAADLWQTGASLLTALLSRRPSQPDWVIAYHQKALLEGGFALMRSGLKQKTTPLDRSATTLRKARDLFVQLLANYPDQPDWVIEAFSKVKDELKVTPSSDPIAATAALGDAEAAPVKVDSANVLECHFVNFTDELVGLVKLHVDVRLPSKAGQTVALTVRRGEATGHKHFSLNEVGTAMEWFGVHTHLLTDGKHCIQIDLTDNEGCLLANATLSAVVKNAGTLARKVRASLKKKDTPLFVSGHCDSTMYDYTDDTLAPWFDRPDAIEQLEKWKAQKRISETEFEQFKGFVVDGFIVLENLIDEDLIAQINAEVDAAVDAGYQGYQRGSSQRITLLHKISPPIKSLLFDRRYLRVLDTLFQTTAQPCQSLLYVHGSQQDAHQDTVHLTPFPAGYMCGIWIALEDIQNDSGELEVFKGSHRLPRQYMSMHQCAKVKDDWAEFGSKFVTHWRSELEAHGFEKIIYRPRKGTVLIWHENLMHAGGVRKNLDLTRRSIVFHCFADGSVNYYDASGEVGMIERRNEVA